MSLNYATLTKPQRDEVLLRFAVEMSKDFASLAAKLVLSEQERVVYAGKNSAQNSRGCRLMFMSENDSLPLKNQLLVDSWMEKFATVYNIQRSCISNLVTCHLHIGDNIETLADFTVVQMKNENTKCDHLLRMYQDQVVLLQFCRTSSIQDTLKGYESLMQERYKEWNEQAAIVTCFVDDDVSLVQQYTQSIPNLQNYWLQDGWNGSANTTAVQQYGIHGVPHAILIDTEGYVQWIGAYMDDKNQLERWIDALLEGRGINVSLPEQEDENEQVDTKRQRIHQLEWSKVDDSEAILEKLKEKRDSLFDADTISFTSLRQRNATNGTISTKGFLTIIGELSSDDRNTYENEFIRDFVHTTIASDAVSRVTFFDRPSIPSVVETCKNCTSSLHDLPKYVQDGETYCYTCSLNTNITLILQPGIPNPKVRWGIENIHPIPNDKLFELTSNVPHKGVACDVCDSFVVGFRYKSCHVTDYDLCGPCYEKWQSGETETLARDSVIARIPPNACSTAKMFYDDAYDVRINACGHSHQKAHNHGHVH